MAVQADYAFSRQTDDLAALHSGIKAFEKDMKKVMVLMTELGTSLESVSRSFDALTSLSFTNEEVKHYVRHFSEAVVEMKQGAPFQNYNRLVHEEVLQPVQELKTSLKEADTARKTRESAEKKRLKARAKVDKTESAYAAKGKSLDECRSYSGLKEKRERAAETFQASDEVFQNSFQALIHRVEDVTSKTMKRYLELNAGYMSSVMDSLVAADPTVNEAVELYRRQLQQERQSEIARQRAQVAQEISRLSEAPSMDASPVQTQPNRLNASLPTSSSRRAKVKPGALNDVGAPLSQSGSAVQEAPSQPATLSKRRQRVSSDVPVSGGPPVAVTETDKPWQPDAAATRPVDVQGTAHVDPVSPLTTENLQPMRPAPAPGGALEGKSDKGSDAPSTVVPSSGYYSAQKRVLAKEFHDALHE